MFTQICVLAVCAVLSAQASCLEPISTCGNIAPVIDGCVGSSIGYADGSVLADNCYSGSGLIDSGVVGGYAGAYNNIPIQESNPCIAPLSQRPVITAPTVVTSLPARATINLPAPPRPAPRVVYNKCVCKRVIEEPQVIRRLVEARGVQRYRQTYYTPVSKTVRYSGSPSCNCGSGSLLANADFSYGLNNGAALVGDASYVNSGYGLNTVVGDAGCGLSGIEAGVAPYVNDYSCGAVAPSCL